ncbi:MAG: hypothetical protein HRF49_06110 [bacterium]|jgi:hypothetical protein
MSLGVVINLDQLDADTVVKGQHLGSVILVDASVDKLLLGADVASVLDARVTCRQPVTDAAIPVLELAQDDSGESFISFSGSASATCGATVLVMNATGSAAGPFRANAGQIGLQVSEYAVQVELKSDVNHRYYMPLFLCEDRT